MPEFTNPLQCLTIFHINPLNTLVHLLIRAVQLDSCSSSPLWFLGSRVIASALQSLLSIPICVSSSPLLSPLLSTSPLSKISSLFLRIHEPPLSSPNSPWFLTLFFNLLSFFLNRNLHKAASRTAWLQLPGKLVLQILSDLVLQSKISCLFFSYVRCCC